MQKKRVYQIDNEPILKVEKDDLNIYNFYLTNKGYKRLQVKFVKIESTCDYDLVSF